MLVGKGACYSKIDFVLIRRAFRDYIFGKKIAVFLLLLFFFLLIGKLFIRLGDNRLDWYISISIFESEKKSIEGKRFPFFPFFSWEMSC